MIKGLHHAAYRCRDSEETRAFYEDFLGLPLANAFEIKQTMTGRETGVLHSFFRMDDGSFMAFFEAPGQVSGHAVVCALVIPGALGVEHSFRHVRAALGD